MFSHSLDDQKLIRCYKWLENIHWWIYWWWIKSSPL